MVAITGKPFKFHINKDPGTSGITLDQVIAHRLYDELLDSKDHYAPDVHLWMDATRRGKDGRAVR